MAGERILIIEDDPDIRELLSVSLAGTDWELSLAESGEAGLALLREKGADCLLLDIMLPGIDGLEVLRRLKARPEWNAIPVILATAKGEEADIVAGLDLGADDYVVKPYSPKVLTARVRAALRRSEAAPAGQGEPGFWEEGGLSLDARRHQAFWKGTALDLSATEFEVLRVFLSRPGEVFTRGKLIAAVRGDDYPVTDRSVDVQILGLRRKLGEAGDFIETVRGVGYRFTPS
ncbi:response regulator transcription factor [Breznakiella homolactica]|uniref:Response regulator transcription factor n=1 Tax=Breznakiella homolactica TaxID=2798577 RepID=A0A7T8B7T9_9SPIR|nr:response regulator transcription factor [Breznakiella homolactica]QQO07879.1 response regulator transcription factor [Breznakiella homolactica]